MRTLLHAPTWLRCHRLSLNLRTGAATPPTKLVHRLRAWLSILRAAEGGSFAQKRVMNLLGYSGAKFWHCAP